MRELGQKLGNLLGQVISSDFRFRQLIKDENGTFEAKKPICHQKKVRSFTTTVFRN